MKRINTKTLKELFDYLKKKYCDKCDLKDLKYYDGCSDCHFMMDVDIALEPTNYTNDFVMCPFCQGKKWIWHQPLPLSMLPAGNYGRFGNETKETCSSCEGKGYLEEGDFWFESVKKDQKKIDHDIF